MEQYPSEDDIIIHRLGNVSGIRITKNGQIYAIGMNVNYPNIELYSLLDRLLEMKQCYTD
jgi:hypothetical protein